MLNHMEYLDGMENIGSEIQDKVISAMNEYIPENYPDKDVINALEIMLLKVLRPFLFLWSGISKLLIISFISFNKNSFSKSVLSSSPSAQ